MAKLTLIIGNKKYSTWSLRPWLVLKMAKADFEEHRVALYTAETKAQLAGQSPTGKVPALIHGEVRVWDSLAICEYIAELYPEARLWPSDPARRAHARSICAEMHSGFQALRSTLPMNLSAARAQSWFPQDVRGEISRIKAIWTECLERAGGEGPFLFGHFTIADAMFAPVTQRFRVYGVPLEGIPATYVRTIAELPAVREWEEAGRGEAEVVPQYE